MVGDSVAQLPEPAASQTTLDDAALPEPPQEQLRIAVIVPFRDNHAAQKRQAHLDKFVPHMTALLSKQSDSRCARSVDGSHGLV